MIKYFTIEDLLKHYLQKKFHTLGFAETLEGNKYFCVYLGQSDAGNTSSTAAKEIAIQILNDNK